MTKIFSAVLTHRILLPVAVAVLWSAPCLAAADGKPENFASPEQAATALVTAARDDDAHALLRIYGAAGRDIVSSGDKVADREAHAAFAGRYGERNVLRRDTSDHATLVIGNEAWPFPIPLVRRGRTWHFDARAGAEEILDRRIGRDELNAIEVCRSYVQAQRDYAADLPAASTPAEYARKIVSSPGQHDGLYWPVQPGEKESPIGPQMASARAEGYAAEANPAHPAPYHGYYYKILTRQGPGAPGGARDYIVDGHMTGGFALLAFPAKYGDSGVTSFIVNQDGLVFQKDLGPATASLAPAMTAFDPDLSWKLP